MAVDRRYIRYQGPVLKAIGRTALTSIEQGFGPKRIPTPPATPGRVFEATLSPRPPELLRDFVRHVGGNPAAYGEWMPPHFFPHWVLPIAARTLNGVTYPMTRALNAGCRMEVHGRMRADQPLHIKAWLDRAEDDGERALFTQRVITGTHDEPEAMVCEMRVIVPMARPDSAKPNGKKGAKKPQPTVPAGAREIAFRSVAADAGLDFAFLTGDFNPIHWLPPYARMSGFKNVIMHGFGTFTRAYEAITAACAGGDPFAIREMDVRFRRPLVLPRGVGFFVDNDGGVFVADGPSAPLYMSGTYRIESGTGGEQ